MSPLDLFAHPLGRLSLDALPFWEMVQDPTRTNVINGLIGTGAAS